MPDPKATPSSPWKTAILAGMASYLDAAALVTSGITIGGYYAAPLQLSAGTIGSLLGLQTLAFAVGALFGGQLGDRFGRRTIFNETADVAVRHPFGHGLSYTSFEQTDFRVTPTGPDTATANVTVTNTGDRSGKHVVQIYVAAPERPVSSPARELRGFAKVALAPGESTTVAIALDRRAFAYWDITRDDWTVATGQYEVQLADNAHDVVATATLVLKGDNLLRPLTLDSTVSEWFTHPTVGPALTAAMTSGLPEEQAAAAVQGNADALHSVVHGDASVRRVPSPTDYG
jgi:hypothetical protein